MPPIVSPSVNKDSDQGRELLPVGDPLNDVDWQDEYEVAEDKWCNDVLDLFGIFHLFPLRYDAASKSHEDYDARQHHNEAGKTNSKWEREAACCEIKPIDCCKITVEDVTLSKERIKPVLANQATERCWGNA